MKRPKSVPGAQTLGMKYPTDLLFKLDYDIARLDSAKYSRDAAYAIFDCASDAWHMVDWCLVHGSDQQIKKWTGLKRDERGLTSAFVATNKEALPYLEWCQQIANSFKHLSLNKYDEKLTSHTSVRFDPPFQAGITQELNMTAVGNFVHYGSGERLEAGQMFRDLAKQWATFLTNENLASASSPDIEAFMQRVLLHR